MAGGDLKFVISAVDNASKALGQVGRETEKLGKGVAGLNAAARVISAGAIIAFGAASVKAFADAEKSQVKLEQAYRRFPALATVQISALREMNQALQDKTGADADSLAAAQATLAQFKLTGDQIKQLTPLLVDYAQVTGQDVTTAASSLGRAFMGNTRALKAIGIDFKATGDTAKDFGSIYAALEGQVGGAGEAFGETTAGQLQILQQSFQDLQEEVGAQLVPALQSFVAVVKPILNAFGQLPAPIKTAIVWLGAAGAAFLLLAPRIIAVSGAMKGIVPAAAQAIAGLKAQSSAAQAAAATNTAAAAQSAAAWRGVALAVGVAMLGVGGAIELSTEEQRQQLETQDQQIADWAEAHKDRTAEAKQSLLDYAASVGVSQDKIAEVFPKAAAAVGLTSAAMAGLADATGEAGEETQKVTEKMPIFTDKAKRAKDAINALKSALDLLGGKQISVDDAMSTLQQSIDDATESTKGLEGATKNAGSALNLQEPAGRSAQEALAGIARAADDLAVAQTEAGVSTATIVQGQKNARAAFIAAAEAAGLTTPAAKALADAYGLIPPKVGTEVSLAADEAMGVDAEFKRRLSAYNSLHPTATLDANGAPAENVLSETERRLNRLDGRTVRFNIVGQYTGKPIPVGAATGGYIQGFDVGGSVRGAGTGTSDSIPAMLSNGEYVIRASAVSRIGLPLLDDINDNGRIDRRRGYAVGGGVTPNQRFIRFQNAVNTAIEEEQELKDLFDARRQSAASMKTRQAGFASISNSFDTGAYAGAQKDVEAARRRLNTAATPQDAAAAREELAAAEQKAADSKPTAGNLIKGLRAKMRALTSFAADLKALVAKKKIPTAILRDIIAAGPEEGGALAKALLSAKTPELDELVKIQGQIDEAASFIGAADANLEYNPQIRRQRGVVNRALARAEQRRNEFLAVRTQVTIDGKQVAEALANYKRAQGGRKLGLD